MGVLETMVAVRDVDRDRVVAALVALCAAAGVATTPHPGGSDGRHAIGVSDPPGPVLRPYFHQLTDRGASVPALLGRPPRAPRDDASHLLGGWVTQDLWRRIGIADDGAEPAVSTPLTSDESSAVAHHLGEA